MSLPKLKENTRVFFAFLRRHAAPMVLGLANFLLMGLGVALLVTVLGLSWLASDKGNTWIAGQINAQALSGTGYRLALSGTHLRPDAAIRIGNLRLYHHDTLYAEGRNLVFDLSLHRLMARHLSFALSLDGLTVYALPPEPASTTDNNPAWLIPITATLKTAIGSMPFDQVTLDRWHIKRLVFMDAFGRPGPALQPQLSAQVRRDGDGLSLAAAFAQVFQGETPQEKTTGLTADLTARLHLDEKPSVEINNLTLHHKGMQVLLSGTLPLPIRNDDFSPLPLSLHLRVTDETDVDHLAQFTGDIHLTTHQLGISNLHFSGMGAHATGQLLRLSTADTFSGNITLQIDFDAFKAVIGPLTALPLSGETRFSITLDDGAVRLAAPRLQADAFDLRDILFESRRLAAGDRTGDRTVTTSLRDAASNAQLRLSLDLLHSADPLGIRAEQIDGRLTLGPAGTLRLTGDARLDAIDLTLQGDQLRTHQLQGPMAPGPNIPALGIDRLRLRVQGSADAPQIETSATITPLAPPQGAPPLSLHLAGDITDGTLRASAAVKSPAFRTAEARMHHPLRLSLFPFFLDVPVTPLDGEARLEGDLDALNGLLPHGLTLKGRIILNTTLSGTREEPSASGRLRLAEGAINESSSGLRLQNIGANIGFDENLLQIDTFSAQDPRGGRITAKGRLTLTPGSWPVDAAVSMHDINPFTRAGPAAAAPLIEGVISGDLSLTGARNAYMLRGEMRADRLLISLPERFTGSIPQLNIVEKNSDSPASGLPGLDALELTVRFVAPQQVFVRGWGLDAEFGGTLSIEGQADNPVVIGHMQSLRGRYEEFGRRFSLARARLDFRGPIPPSPYLDVVAETMVDGVQAQVIISGSAEAPTLAFASMPHLPQEDILARLLFGRSRSGISPTQALQMAQTLQRLTGGGGGGLDPLGALRSGIGLDDLSIDTDGQGETVVGAGKYLADNVYLELETGTATQSGAAKLRIELTPKIKLESRIGQDAESGAGVFWEWDY